MKDEAAVSTTRHTPNRTDRRGWSLKTYMVALVVLVVAVAGGKVVYQWASARDDAEASAREDAQFAADLAVRSIDDAIGLATTQVASTAASPGLDALFDGVPGCTLTFGGAGPFVTGHLDIVGRDGNVFCSSLPDATPRIYASSTWLSSSLSSKDPHVATERDERTGKDVVVVAAPISERGVVVALLDIDSVTRGLETTLGGPRHLQFLVRTGDALALDDDHFYASSAQQSLGWDVYAGANRSDAFAAADELSNRNLFFAVLGLVVFLFAAYVVYRHIARPIRELSSGVRAATLDDDPEPLDVPGPREITTLVQDFNALIAAQKQTLELEARLRQSERLESLGQLAGGIAHDFNNLLAAIMNYASFVAEETADQPEIRADAEQIQAAAQQAARLTRQLLIFGRRDAVLAEVLDLNSVVQDVHQLLSRSLGEHIEMALDLGDDLPSIMIDRGQLEQVMVNLAVNARDAMPQGGTLTVETRLAHLDDDHARTQTDVTPGTYVELTVSDTGSGMTREVATHIFEPFFTTKEKGQGTGLGLATLYGIVREAGGSVGVYSEVAVGTTFRVYFPAVDAVTPAPDDTAEAPPHGAGQTILVVEDEQAILDVTSRMLRHHGYTVFEASTFDVALAHASGNEIDLLLTDSVMPEASGRSLAERIDELRPNCRVLFMSGYSQGVLGPQRVLPDGAELIQKPFSQRELLAKVHALLSAPQEG